jgi:hypothetical protein
LPREQFAVEEVEVVRERLAERRAERVRDERDRGEQHGDEPAVGSARRRRSRGGGHHA